MAPRGDEIVFYQVAMCHRVVYILCTNFNFRCQKTRVRRADTLDAGQACACVENRAKSSLLRLSASCNPGRVVLVVGRRRLPCIHQGWGAKKKERRITVEEAVQKRNEDFASATRGMGGKQCIDLLL